MQPKQTAASQVQNLQLNFSRIMARKAELLEQLEGVNAQIKSIRDAMHGIQIGQQLEKEVVAEQAKAAEKDRLAEQMADAANKP
jgi:Trm5-related predicted tRNA methylase